MWPAQPGLSLGGWWCAFGHCHDIPAPRMGALICTMQIARAHAYGHVTSPPGSRRLRPLLCLCCVPAAVAHRMANQATKRLKKELMTLIREPEPYIRALPLPSNILGERRLTRLWLCMHAQPPTSLPAPRPLTRPIPAPEWHYCITGPEDTPYAGGEYHGKLIFPPQYPFKVRVLRWAANALGWRGCCCSGRAVGVPFAARPFAQQHLFIVIPRFPRFSSPMSH